jgi:hypothetical protein
MPDMKTIHEQRDKDCPPTTDLRLGAKKSFALNLSAAFLKLQAKRDVGNGSKPDHYSARRG